MFDNEAWGVDKMAATLDSSLFGPVTKETKKHKQKKKKTQLVDTELTGKSELKTELKRKAIIGDDSFVSVTKKKKRGDNWNNSTNENSSVKELNENTAKGNTDQKSLPKRKKKKKRKSSENVNIAGDNVTETNISSKMVQKSNLDVNSKVNDTVENSITKKKRQKRKKEKKRQKKKRKSNLDISLELPVPKKSKDEETITGSENKTGLTRKERRNKRKKKNRKKNKFLRLSLANQTETNKTGNSSCDSSALNITEFQDSVHRSSDGSTRESQTGVDSGSPRKKKKKCQRKLDLTENVESQDNVDSKEKVDEDTPDISSKKKKKAKRQNSGEHELKTLDEGRHIFPQKTCSKNKTPTKQNFDVLKLKEIMMSGEKKINMYIDEQDKKSAKKRKLMLGQSLKNGTQKEPDAKREGKDAMTRKKGSEAEILTGDSKVGNKKSKTPKKQVSNVTMMDEVLSSEKKKEGHGEERKKKKRMRGGEMSLKERMEEQLNAARFRYLNEQLYTTTGAEAAELFEDDDHAFHVYHQGYESQVSKWPVDPLRVLIKQIKAKHKSPGSDTVIADMGCGSARLAQAVTGVKVHSFDFVAANELVTACNMSEVPLEDESVDVVVFCLSLMGTNLVDYLLEANRILKTGGTMKIAEVESRFKKVGAFVSKVEKLGFEIIIKDLSNKMFYLFDFKKVKDVGTCSSIPVIELEPCVYKKR